ncbi:MAG: HD-GYP domain-containing protein [bacterium]|nr:HD-GYP domain-containing protein [bacterium]
MSIGNDRLFSGSTLALVFFSIMLNTAGNGAVSYFNVPAYLDTAGTILSAALGGFMPGVIVGFFSNVLNSFDNMNNLYYGVVNIFVGLFSTVISQNGGFRGFARLPLYALLLSLVGGVLGSAITWGLLGSGGWREMISASASRLTALWLLPDDAAYFLAGGFIDYYDKLFSAAAVVAIIRALPRSFLARLPLGHIYLDELPRDARGGVSVCRRMSIRTKVGALMISTYCVLGLISAAIIYYMYSELGIAAYVKARDMTALSLGAGGSLGADSFIIRVLSLIFGAGMFLLSFSLWYTQRAFVAPLRRMAAAANIFLSQLGASAGEEILEPLNIRTGDEIEYLYEVLSTAANEIALRSNLIRNGNSEIAQKNEVISMMQDHIIFCFASLVENRDDSTGGHIWRTSRYVRAICDEMRADGKYGGVMTAQFCEALERSAPLHDIGKIKVPDSVLLKKGPFTKEEFEVMKTHASCGANIIKKVFIGKEEDDYFSEAYNMALYHHERWDGGGYPEGLRGREIPLSARIMAVADVFDALLSKRSYKDPYPFDHACSMVMAESGKHFDPDVTRAFENAKGKLRAIYFAHDG